MKNPLTPAGIEHVLSINLNYGEVEIESAAHMTNNGNTNVKESLYTYYRNHKEN